MFKKITRLFARFTDESTDRESDWNELEAKKDVNRLIKSSDESPQLVFKHSPRCSISSMVEGEMNRLVDLVFDEGLEVGFHKVDVVNDRDISQYISERSEVPHESPQVLLWVGESVRWHDSHTKIKADKVLERIKAQSSPVGEKE